jgi:hypothetical protein
MKKGWVNIKNNTPKEVTPVLVYVSVVKCAIILK